jgi:3-methyladenine DNA glycosylase/8-oxoguanine DNA glycosylase
VAIGAAHTEAIETSIRPSGPYWLSASARRAGDRTRRFRDGVLTCVFETDGAPAHARVWQDSSGAIQIRLQSPEPEAALDALRFVLAVDDDHTAFLRRFGSDRFIGMATFRLRGLRPLRTATVTHALLRALCGQLISAREARRIEARCIASWSPARLCSHGLVARKASALVRISRSFDLERLRNVPTDAAVRRIEQERMLGPWSAGVICLEGLGRYEQGLVGDLGLMRLCTRLLGREATVEDTVELLRPYGEWAGLASIYLLASAA